MNNVFLSREFKSKITKLPSIKQKQVIKSLEAIQKKNEAIGRQIEGTSLFYKKVTNSVLILSKKYRDIYALDRMTNTEFSRIYKSRTTLKSKRVKRK